MRNRLRRVMLLEERIVHANAGGEHTLAVTENGQLCAWASTSTASSAGRLHEQGAADPRDEFEQISETSCRCPIWSRSPRQDGLQCGPAAHPGRVKQELIG